MSARYVIWAIDTSGNRIVLLDEWQRLEYTLQVNGFHYHTLNLSGDSRLVPELVVDLRLEIYREDRINGIEPYKEYEGFHRTVTHQTNADGQQLVASFGRGYDDLLTRRSILYYSGTAGASKNGPGESVIKEFVEENAGPSATTANGRIFDGVIPGFTVAPDGAQGLSFTGSKAYRNLLEVCQDVGQASNITFKVVGTGATTFEFRTKEGLWGDDRSVVGLDPLTGLNAQGNTPVIFALNFQNMASPLYSDNRTNEGNAIIVLGQGLGVARAVIERTDPLAIVASPWNRREVTRQANMETTTAGLEAIGDDVLTELVNQKTFTFDALQTDAFLYGRDYFLGDIVTARYLTFEENFQITQVKVVVQDGVERISLEISRWAHEGDVSPLLRRLRALEAVES